MKETKPDQDGGLTFVATSGSPVGGRHKEKGERITDAMKDLQLGLDGLRTQLSGPCDGAQMAQALRAFARTCSLFLRKTVLGDHGRRETRLLDDRVLATMDSPFARLRKIPASERREIRVSLGHAGAVMELTKLDDNTLQPQTTHLLRAAPQKLELLVEWPLPGAALWTGVPSEEEPWQVNHEQLFDMNARSGLGCDEWLGQQVVLFDGKGVSLKEIVRTVANYEGAHSINVGRLSAPEGEVPSQATKNPTPHLLNSMCLFGIPYLNLIVIESALHLYRRLLSEHSIQRPGGEIFIATPALVCAPDQAQSPQPDWLRFEGHLMVSFSPTPTVIRHSIRAPK